MTNANANLSYLAFALSSLDAEGRRSRLIKIAREHKLNASAASRKGKFTRAAQSYRRAAVMYRLAGNQDTARDCRRYAKAAAGAASAA